MLTTTDLQRILFGKTIVFAARVGSQVYGCSTQGSDTDFVAVVEEPVIKNLLFGRDYNVTLYNPLEYQLALNEQSLYALEALWAPESHRMVCTRAWAWTLNGDKLKARVVASSDADFAKGVKLIQADPDKARKKVWHSLRTLLFARQLIEDGHIRNFGAGVEDHWLELMTDPAPDSIEEFGTRWGKRRDHLKRILAY